MPRRAKQPAPRIFKAVGGGANMNVLVDRGWPAPVHTVDASPGGMRCIANAPPQTQHFSSSSPGQLLFSVSLVICVPPNPFHCPGWGELPCSSSHVLQRPPESSLSWSQHPPG